MWERVFAYVRGFSSLLAGVLSYLYGDLNGLLVVLCVVIVLDYVTGLLKAGITHQLSSEIGFKGILKKILLLVIVALAHLIDKAVFFICSVWSVQSL